MSKIKEDIMESVHKCVNELIAINAYLNLPISSEDDKIDVMEELKQVVKLAGQPRKDFEEKMKKRLDNGEDKIRYGSYNISYTFSNREYVNEEKVNDLIEKLKLNKDNYYNKTDVKRFTKEIIKP